MKPVNFSDFKKIQKFSLNEFNRWMMTLYETAFEDGLREGESEFDDCIATISEDRLLEILLSVKGIGVKRAEKIIATILNEGVFNGIEA